MSPTRSPAVAGLFYPASAAELAATVRELLDQAASSDVDARPPKALIVPHAGYIYSGAVAASAYRLVAPRRSAIRRVVLLGPAHRVALRGMAVPQHDRFQTPLGDVKVDTAALAGLGDLSQVVQSDAAHTQEHSLEVHLPFLQALLDDFTLVPLVVGSATEDEVAQVLERLWGGEETLVVISSDLSHYHRYTEARRIDGATAQTILRRQPVASHEQACGATPINGLLAVARRRGMSIRQLDLCNSGDTAGDRSRVVGYGAFALWEGQDAATGEHEELGGALLRLARSAIADRLGLGSSHTSTLAALERPGATFVTLTRHGELRGCIGSLEARRPLARDVTDNAVSAAFRDPRFPRLKAPEFMQIRVEVSLLNEPEFLEFGDEAQALAQLRPGIDGAILIHGCRRATFLPQVWEQLPQPQQFVAMLKRKAGLPADFWQPDVQIARYQVVKWREPEPAR
ncbi:MAG: AmmeMemoRadiSam system protein B [Betaproteobacteria bacterium]|nr:AmmeMemoRadiSam system protein B [Betaproteobacteria bacterium]